MRRLFRLGIFAAILSVFFAAVAPALASSSLPFSRTLTLGSSGPEVLELQKLLNSDPDTQIAMSGPGSPGNESSYFGWLTKAAVIRFQEKYASSILVPNGLTTGTGIVGSSTRTVLDSLSRPSVAQESPSDSTSTLSAPASAPTPQVLTNPNLKNLDLYISAVEKEGTKQGLSKDKIAYLAQKIRDEAATTTDFMAMFMKQQQEAYLRNVSQKTPITGFVDRIIAYFDQNFGVQTALAGIGLPFGGYITYVNPGICDCPPGVVTQILVVLPESRNPAISDVLLNYVNGTEGFLWHNLPLMGIATKGIYIPGVQSCITYYGYFCAPFPAEGQITPEVGSSLL